MFVNCSVKLNRKTWQFFTAINWKKNARWKRKMCNEVECEYKDRCTSHPSWCNSCARNKAKRNFYVPIPYPINPYPWPYTWPWIICTVASGTCQQTGNYFVSNQTIWGEKKMGRITSMFRSYRVSHKSSMGSLSYVPSSRSGPDAVNFEEDYCAMVFSGPGAE